MARTGLGRHGRIEDAAGDPLEGLVNLFDIGIVLAVAFLIAGLSLTLNTQKRQLQKRPAQQTQALSAPANAPHLKGRGQPVGTVYRLGDGSLVLVKPNASQASPSGQPGQR
jgi:hypothetical protein